MIPIKGFLPLVCLFLCSFIYSSAQQCSINVSDRNPCPGESVTFTVSNPQNGVVYGWDFDEDGMVDKEGTQAGYSFPHNNTSTTIRVQLFRDDNGCGTVNVNVKPSPDPQIISADLVQNGNTFSACQDEDNIVIEFFNDTKNTGSISSYTINWGDGSSDTYNNSNFSNTTPISHTFQGLGIFPIQVTAQGTNGCNKTTRYRFFNGTNPTIGLSNPGNTVGLCAPATLTFPIIDAEKNPPGTTYEIFINEELVQSYNQDNIPTDFIFDFEDSSCGKVSSDGRQNSFDVKITASNPCSSTSAIVSPIQTSLPPKVKIDITEPEKSCPGETFTFADASTDILEIINNECVNELSARWDIMPGSDGVEWSVTSGGFVNSESLEVRFNTSGTYTISLTLKSRACGDVTTTETVVIQEPPTAEAMPAIINGTEGCAPVTYRLENRSKGLEPLTYNWSIMPEEGWTFVNNSNENSKNPEVQFIEGGSYTIALVTSNECDEDEWTTMLQVFSKPNIVLTKAEDVCETASLNFDNESVMYDDNGKEITTYAWSFEGAMPSSSNEAFPKNIQYNTPGTYIYSMSVTNSCGTAVVRDTFIVQNPSVLDLPIDQTVCINTNPFQLNASPEGGQWSGNGVDENGLFDPSMAQIGSNTLTYQFGTGVCSSEAQTSITVTNLPVINVGTYDNVCENDSPVILNGTPGGGNWTISNDGVIENNQFDPRRSGPGIYELTYQYEDEVGCINSERTTIEVFVTPEIQVEGATLCNTPGLVDLPVALPEGGVWSGQGVSNNQFNPQTAGGIGTYELTYTFTDVNGCSVSEVVSIIVGEPDVVSAGPDATVCFNDEVLDLSEMASPAGGNWAINSGNGLNGSQFNPELAGPGTYILTYSIGAGSCRVEDQLTITVEDLLAISLANNPTEICEDIDTVELIASPEGGSWSNENEILPDDLFFPKESGIGNYSLVYSYTDENGCKNDANLLLVVHALPEIRVNDTTYCNTPGQVDLPNAQPSGGEWEGTGVNGSRFDPQVAGGVGTYDLRYSYQDDKGCINSKEISITVIEPDFILAGPDTSFCVSETSYNLNDFAQPAGGNWSFSGNQGFANGIFNPSDAGEGTFTFLYAVGNGNCLVQDELTIIVEPLPELDLSQNNQVACISEARIPLKASPVGGEWTSEDGGVIDGSDFLPNASGVGQFNLVYTYSDANGCQNQNQLLFTVYPLPEISVRDTTYCNTPGQVQLPKAEPAGGNWEGAGVTGLSFDPQIAGGVGVYQIVYTFSDDNNCKNSDTITVSVIEPDLVVAGSDTSLCVSASNYDLGLFAQPSGGSWSVSGNQGLMDNIFDPSSVVPDIYTLTYEVGTGNCAVRDELIIEVQPLPSIDLSGNQSEVCVSEISLELQAIPSGGKWSVDNNGILEANNFLPNVSGEGVYELTYNYLDENGCSNQESIMLEVNPLPLVQASDTTYCNTPGQVMLPLANPLAGVWSGAGVDGNLFNPVLAGGVGTYNLVYTYSDANNCSNTDIIAVSVIEPEIVNAGPDTSFCVSVERYELNLFAVPTGGVWEIVRGNGLDGNTFNPNIAGPGLFELVYKVGVGNCLVADTLVVEVLALPEIDLTANSNSTCVSEEFIELIGTPNGGEWTVDNGGFIDGNQFKPNQSGIGDYELTYSYTDRNGCTNQSVLDFTVFPLPKLLVNDSTFCNTPGKVELPKPRPSGGIWSGIAVEGNSFDPQGAGGVGDYDLTYAFKDPNGCIDSIPVLISVIEPEVVEAGLNDTICITDGIKTLIGFSPENGSWSGPGITTSNNAVFDPELAGGGKHTLVYAFGAGNCEVKDSIFIQVIDLRATNAGLDEAFCLTDPQITLSGQSPLGGVWEGPGIVNENGIFSPELAGLGTHILTYTYTDNFSGCSAQSQKIITIFPMPESAFSIPEETCINQEVAFQNESTIIGESLWDFGDGNTSTDPNPIHIYRTTGTYTIILKSVNENGCMDMATKTIFVTEPPTVTFDKDVNEGCAILPVNFFNNSFGYEVEYFWNFGDGQISELDQPGTIYFDQGPRDTTYLITLTAKNPCATKTFVDSVTVFPLPIATIGTNIDTSCTPMEVTFANFTQGNPESYRWDLGNGFSSTDSIPKQVIYYTDTTVSVYPVQLIATNFCGSDTATKNIIVKPVEVRSLFNTPGDRGCQPYEITFTNYATTGTFIEYDFGDGNQSSEPNPTHIFEQPGTFRVIQYANNGCGYDSTFRDITVLPAPEVQFEHPDFVCVGQPIDFTNNSPGLAGSLWDFGDGDSSLLTNPSHVYEFPGTYRVRLTGTSTENGCLAQVESEVVVIGLPSASFEPEYTDGCAPFELRFNNTSIGASYYHWDFGDQNTSAAINPVHLFHDPGTYTVKLIATDLNGCFNDTSILNIIVHPVPKADFTIERDILCGTPVRATFKNRSTGGSGYAWEIDGNPVSSLIEPQYTFQDTGWHDVQLIVTNPFQCTDTSQKRFKVYPIPMAEFDVDPAIGCAPYEAQMINLSTFANRHTWTFTDGGVRSEESPIYTFYEPGNYGVKLNVSYDDICFDSIFYEDFVTVLPSPFASFTYEEDNNPEPHGSFLFFNQSEDAVRYFWDFNDGVTSEEENPTHRFYTNGPQQVLLQAIGVNDCVDDTLVTLIPTFFKGLFIPNAFSPEQGIGEVQLFKPKGIGIKEYLIQIYSQHGELIWESSELEAGSPSEAWDGTKNGELLKPDVYVWKCRAIFEDGTVWPGMQGKNGKAKTIGSLVLLR